MELGDPFNDGERKGRRNVGSGYILGERVTCFVLDEFWVAI